VAFADSVLHLVRAGARIDPWVSPDDADSAELPVVPADAVDAAADADADAEVAEHLAAELAAHVSSASHEFEPGLGDLEAAVELVSAGLAKRVVLSGFQSWPGLLWRAYQLADTTDVLILPTVVRPGGKVDIVITRDISKHG
jgi:hypothetical protein